MDAPLTPPPPHDDHPADPDYSSHRVRDRPPSSPPYGPPDDALATSHVGNYTLYATIGQGAFGKVKIAVHRHTNARVAIKIMDKSEIRAQEFTQQVRREIYIMRCLKHKHIVRMHEVLTSDTKLYIVMELVTGGELFDRIEHGRVPEHLARQYFQQLVDGVDFCHKKGVAHRDLKPENLLVDENGDIKITDFGFSSMKGRDVNAGLLYTQCGTPDYCAPEIIDSAKDGYNGAKVDAWSCGIILYALLSGRLPFQEQDTEKLYDLILACKVQYSPHISQDARDLLQNLLVRDPSRRYDLQKVKRHPWFLVNYEGDDAKLIKKRPFFNKNQKDLTASAPSSPVTSSQADSNGSARATTPTTSMLPNGEVHTSSPIATTPLYPPAGALPLVHVAYGEGSDPGSSGHRPAMSTEPPREAAILQQQQQQQQQQQGYGHDVASRSSPRTGRPMPPVPRLREEQQYAGMYRPPSPANDLDGHVRSVTPPAHAVFTRVEDRPATPARRQTSAAFKAAKAAAAMHATPVSANGHAVPPVSPSYVQSQGQARISPMNGNGHAQDMYSVPESNQNGNSASYEAAAARFRSNLDVPAQQGNDDDEDSSEHDSTEDYEEKPALRLELPIEPLSRLRSAKDTRRTQLQHSVMHTQQRHRSDLGITAASGPLAGPHAVDNGPASTSSLQLQRRGFTRDGTVGGIGSSDPRVRLTRTSDIPSSPPVVYSPSGNGVPYDRYRSISPGFTSARQGVVSEGSSPNGTYSTGISGFPTAWNGASNSGLPSRDDVGATNGSSFQAPIFSRHLWNMVCKLRGTAAPAGEKLSQDLRADLRLMLSEMSQISRAEDIAAIFSHFLQLFETLGLSDAPVSSPGVVRSQNRSRGTSDMDEDYEDGTTIESREELSANSDVRFGLSRRTGTDMSSEEEPLSWSPVLADSSRHQSDLARRRNISDLLNRWIKKTDTGAIPPTGEKTDRAVYTGDDEEPSSTTDLLELQRLMREHHGGREESNIADEFLRLMDNDGNDDGDAIPFGTNQPGQSPPPPNVQPTRSGDAYTQARYQGSMQGNVAANRPSTPLRSVSGSNVPLPPEYIPGRFKEPNSMPARGHNGAHRQNGLSVRRGANNVDEVGDTLGVNRNRENMANSMGMHDVAYYDSDKKNGMATKLRGVLQTMKVKNQKLGERHAQFRTKVPPDDILRTLGRILTEMGAEVTINRQTRRKMKCHLAMHPNAMLHAGIELTSVEDDTTCVAFRRSRLDKGRTDTDSFHSFFERVRNQFIEEANTLYPNRSKSGERHSRRRNGHGNTTSRQISDSAGQLSIP